MQWFYVKGSNRVGPVSEADFQSAFQRGDITDDTLVWNKTLTEWIAYKDLPEPIASSSAISRPERW